MIDASGLNSTKFSDRSAVAAELGRACREMVSSLPPITAFPMRCATPYLLLPGFFALPEAEKNELSILRSPNDRGYVALQAERLDQTSAVSDHKEAFNIGLEMAADNPEVLAGKPFRGVNFWPRSPVGGRRSCRITMPAGRLAGEFTADSRSISVLPRISSRINSMPRSGRSESYTTRRSPRARSALPTVARARTPITAISPFWQRTAWPACKFAREMDHGSTRRTFPEHSCATSAIV